MENGNGHTVGGWLGRMRWRAVAAVLAGVLLSGGTWVGRGYVQRLEQAEAHVAAQHAALEKIKTDVEWIKRFLERYGE